MGSFAVLVVSPAVKIVIVGIFSAGKTERLVIETLEFISKDALISST